jgi:F0F1-type ATP synthase membrane subunit b/b'
MTDIISEELVVAICFVVFVFFAYRPIKKAVSNALEQKISEIKDNLQKAETLKEEAKSTLELLAKELKNLEQSKTQLLLDAQHNIEHAINLKNEEMKLLFARIENSALQNLQYQADQATENMKKQFIEKTMNLVQNYLKETNNNSLTQKEIIELFTHKK